MEDGCDGNDKTWAFQPIFTLGACEVGLTYQGGEEITMMVPGEEAEIKAESDVCDQSCDNQNRK